MSEQSANSTTAVRSFHKETHDVRFVAALECLDSHKGIGYVRVKRRAAVVSRQVDKAKAGEGSKVATDKVENFDTFKAIVSISL